MCTSIVRVVGKEGVYYSFYSCLHCVKSYNTYFFGNLKFKKLFLRVVYIVVGKRNNTLHVKCRKCYYESIWGRSYKVTQGLLTLSLNKCRYIKVIFAGRGDMIIFGFKMIV